jgi:hypothetical protein
MSFFLIIVTEWVSFLATLNRQESIRFVEDNIGCLWNEMLVGYKNKMG